MTVQKRVFAGTEVSFSLSVKAVRYMFSDLLEKHNNYLVFMHVIASMTHAINKLRNVKAPLLSGLVGRVKVVCN